MSKKETNTLSVREALENTPNLSLRKLALATDVSYGVLLKASKKPIEGVPYDPTYVNYEAVDEVFTRREIDLSSLDLVSIAGEARPKATKEFDLKLGDKYTIRGNDEVYEIVALTKSHVCIQAAVKDESDEVPLRSMSIATFLHQTPKLAEN